MRPTTLISASALLGSASASLEVLGKRQGTTASSPARSSASFSESYLTTVTTSLFPGGTDAINGTQTIESTLPLPCLDGCYYFANPYSYCFLTDTLPNGTRVGPQCDNLCTQAYYDGLSACLNCVVAHGGERPYGYSTNTSLTQYPPRTSPPASEDSVSASIREAQEAQQNPNGLLDANQANAWLRNVTSLCGGRGTTLAGAASVTAVATTTGPFAATWSRGQTISRTAWTGLSQYSPPVTTYVATISGRPRVTSTSSSPSSTGSGSAASSAAASQSSRAAGMETVQRPVGWIVGMVLAWAVL